MVTINWNPSGLIPDALGIPRCAICKKKLAFCAHVFLQHRAERIQFYCLCDNPECYKKMGRKMAQGKY